MRPGPRFLLIVLWLFLPAVSRAQYIYIDTNGDGLADGWECSPKNGSCTRQALAGPGSGWAQVIDVPRVAAGDKPPEVMIAQHDFLIRGGQWYRFSLRARAEGLSAHDVAWTAQNTANWQALFDYNNFAPKADWQPFRFMVQAKDTAAKGTKLQIWFTGGQAVAGGRAPGADPGSDRRPVSGGPVPDSAY